MPRTGLTPKQIKERAIASAEARIRRHGFEKTRLVDIGKDLGISHVALYKHFPDKSALLDCVSERWLAEMDVTLQRICDGPRPPLERLRALFLKLHALKRGRVRLDPELFKAFNVASTERKPFVVRHLDTLNRQIAGLVAEAMQAGELRPGNPAQVTTLLLTATFAYHHPKLLVERLPERGNRGLREILDTLLGGLR